jgi:hypothetical protein
MTREPSARFVAAIAAFDRENARDPRTKLVNEKERPLELVQAERLSQWVVRVDPEASEAVRLAARCQHIRRWEIPRASFPEGRAGYLQWRTQLARFHADVAEAILREVGYDESMIDRVRSINMKQGLRSNPDTRSIEDALCLSFLEDELDAFARKHDAAKVVDVVRKTWKKMTPRGRAMALELPLSDAAKKLIAAALAEGGDAAP